MQRKKQISVAVCVDDALGMMFGGRRQSRDRVLIEDFLKDHCGETVVAGEYRLV